MFECIIQSVILYFPKTSSMNFFNNLKANLFSLLSLPRFFYDYALCLACDRHTSSASSYFLMRRLYSLSRGKSVFFLSAPFHLLHRKSPIPDQITRIASEIRNSGYAKTNPTALLQKLAADLHCNLSRFPVSEVIPDSKLAFEFKNPIEAIHSFHRKGSRLAHKRSDVVQQSETWKLIQLFNMKEVAASYLGCDPIITSIESWHVVPIGSNIDLENFYSATAQTFHYDMDWIRFLKIFVNLTNAPPESGPFEFIPHSHFRKHLSLYRDSRKEILSELVSDPVYANGKMGSAFWADTSGIHRDGRATSSSRHVLQVEFAVSSFGAKFQYEHDFGECKKHMPWHLIPKDLKSGRALALFH